MAKEAARLRAKDVSRENKTIFTRAGLLIEGLGFKT